MPDCAEIALCFGGLRDRSVIPLVQTGIAPSSIWKPPASSSSFLQRCRASVQRCSVPLQCCNAALQRCNAPLQCCNAALQRCNAPLQRCNAPLQGCNAPLQCCRIVHLPFFGAVAVQLVWTLHPADRRLIIEGLRDGPMGIARRTRGATNGGTAAD
ncbi:MAG TPA: hypothetical protein VGN72_11675 [Tepidisphaeraceae bacterium]|jgi:hypothetical protein|nr:hypothetical protein [Tepidisphaeraceae bacterium]